MILDKWLKDQLDMINKNIAKRHFEIKKLDPKVQGLEQEMLKTWIELHDELKELVDSRTEKSSKKCPTCGSNNVIVFTPDMDMCWSCKKQWYI